MKNIILNLLIIILPLNMSGQIGKDSTNKFTPPIMLNKNEGLNNVSLNLELVAKNNKTADLFAITSIGLVILGGILTEKHPNIAPQFFYYGGGFFTLQYLFRLNGNAYMKEVSKNIKNFQEPSK